MCIRDRYGGEEFAIVLADTGYEDVRLLHDRLLAGIRSLRVNIGGTELSVTVSVGVAIATTNSVAGDLIVRADRALYTAKRSGRDRVVVAADELSKAA